MLLTSLFEGRTSSDISIATRTLSMESTTLMCVGYVSQMFTPSFGYYFRRNAFCCGVDNESETLGPSPVLAVSVTYRKCSEVSDASLEGKQAFSCGVDNKSETLGPRSDASSGK